jgi:hypothetical protein
MDIEDMRDVILRHGTGEMTRDWDLALATMTDDCVYRFYPYRVQITGTPSIVELWSRFVPPSGPLPPFDWSNRLPDRAEMTEYLNGDSFLRVASSEFVDPDGVQRGTTHVTRFDFRDGLIAREIVFFDATFMHWTDAVFDEQFRSLPGVVQL